MRKKLVTLSQFVPYTKKELELLYKMLSSEYRLPGILDPLQDEINGEPYFLRDENDRSINFMQFLAVYFRKIFLFLTFIPLKNVPLYINKKQIKVFAEWRLLINK